MQKIIYEVDRAKIIETLQKELEPKTYIHALWEEGSFAQNHSDEYSDLDLWVSVDGDKIFSIYNEIEQILNKLGRIDFKYINKSHGELGSNTYHIKGTSEYLQIDFNTQSINREIYLTRGIDDTNVLFDKQNVIKYQERKPYNRNINEKREKLRNFYTLMEPRLTKSIKREQPLEELYYWHLVLRYATTFLRRKYGWHDKIEYDLKHIYHDLPKDVTKNLRDFYDTNIDGIEAKMHTLKEWIWQL